MNKPDKKVKKAGCEKAKLKPHSSSFDILQRVAMDFAT